MGATPGAPMSSPADGNSSILGLTLVGLPLATAAVIAGMVWIPPWISSRDVRSTLATVNFERFETDTDEQYCNFVNERLLFNAVSRYWVKERGQEHDLSLQLRGDQCKVFRQSNGIRLVADWDAQMWVPLLNKVKVIHLHAEHTKTR